MNKTDVYNKHCDLLMHYSSRIFTARVTTITLIVITGIASVGNFNLSFFQPTGPSSPWIPYFFAIVIVFLWMMELGYFKKFNEIVFACADMEKKLNIRTFFKTYHPFTHRIIYLFYLVAVVSIVNSSNFTQLEVLPLYVLILLPIQQMLFIANLWVDEKQFTIENKDQLSPIGRKVWEIRFLIKRTLHSLSFICFGKILNKELEYYKWVPALTITLTLLVAWITFYQVIPGAVNRIDNKFTGGRELGQVVQAAIKRDNKRLEREASLILSDLYYDVAIALKETGQNSAAREIAKRYISLWEGTLIQIPTNQEQRDRLKKMRKF